MKMYYYVIFSSMSVKDILDRRDRFFVYSIFIVESHAKILGQLFEFPFRQELTFMNECSCDQRNISRKNKLKELQLWSIFG